MSPLSPRPSNVLWREGDRPEPVTPANPLVGIEVKVLQAWLESSPRLQRHIYKISGLFVYPLYEVVWTFQPGGGRV